MWSSWTCTLNYPFKILIALLLDIYAEVGLLYHNVVLFLIFGGTFTVFFHNGCSILHSPSNFSMSLLRFAILYSLWYHNEYRIANLSKDMEKLLGECKMEQPLWKNTVKVPPKIKNRTTLWYNNPTSAYISKRSAIRILKG